MTYPTTSEVEAADRLQLARWYRFLKSPGECAIGADYFEQTMAGEKIIMDRIVERFNGMGGFTPEISKQIGW